jgi:hypothetical protein
MAENPRVAWTIAYDVGSRRLQNENFSKLGVKECKASFADDTLVLVRLRLEKRVRSNPVVEELKRLLHAGRIRRAWIEKRAATNAYDADIDTVQPKNGETVELERVDGSDGLPSPAARTTKKKMRSASATPTLSDAPRADGGAGSDEEEEDVDEEGEEDVEEDDQEYKARIKALIASCKKDIQNLQKSMDQLDQEAQAPKRTKSHHRQASDPKPKPAAPAKPIVKPRGLPYNRPPIKLSFLRTASVSELYYSGVWVPEFDWNNDYQRLPRRESRFRSELPPGEYVEGFDIDDGNEAIKLPDVVHFKNKLPEASGRAHFAETPPNHRPSITLNTLRGEGVDVLFQLGIFFFDYDIDDLNPAPVPTPDRPRKTRTELGKELNHDEFFVANYLDGKIAGGFPFIPNYDIDDLLAKDRAEAAINYAQVIKGEIAEARRRPVSSTTEITPPSSPTTSLTPTMTTTTTRPKKLVKKSVAEGMKEHVDEYRKT